MKNDSYNSSMSALFVRLRRVFSLLLLLGITLHLVKYDDPQQELYYNHALKSFLEDMVEYNTLINAALSHLEHIEISEIDEKQKEYVYYVYLDTKKLCNLFDEKKFSITTLRNSLEWCLDMVSSEEFINLTVDFNFLEQANAHAVINKYSISETSRPVASIIKSLQASAVNLHRKSKRVGIPDNIFLSEIENYQRAAKNLRLHNFNINSQKVIQLISIALVLVYFYILMVSREMRLALKIQSQTHTNADSIILYQTRLFYFVLFFIMFFPFFSIYLHYGKEIENYTVVYFSLNSIAIILAILSIYQLLRFRLDVKEINNSLLKQSSSKKRYFFKNLKQNRDKKTK